MYILYSRVGSVPHLVGVYNHDFKFIFKITHRPVTQKIYPGNDEVMENRNLKFNDHDEMTCPPTWVLSGPGIYRGQFSGPLDFHATFHMKINFCKTWNILSCTCGYSPLLDMTNSKSILNINYS